MCFEELSPLNLVSQICPVQYRLHVYQIGCTSRPLGILLMAPTHKAYNLHNNLYSFVVSQLIQFLCGGNSTLKAPYATAVRYFLLLIDTSSTSRHIIPCQSAIHVWNYDLDKVIRYSTVLHLQVCVCLKGFVTIKLFVQSLPGKLI